MHMSSVNNQGRFTARLEYASGLVEHIVLSGHPPHQYLHRVEVHVHKVQGERLHYFDLIRCDPDSLTCLYREDQ